MTRLLHISAAILALAFACTPVPAEQADAAPPGPTDGRACTTDADCGGGLCIAGTCGFAPCTCDRAPDGTLPGILPDGTKCVGCASGYRCAAGRCYAPCGGGVACAPGRACASACVGGGCCLGGLCSPNDDLSLCTLDLGVEVPDAGAVGSTVSVRATLPTSDPAIVVRWTESGSNRATSGVSVGVGPIPEAGDSLVVAATTSVGTDAGTPAPELFRFAQDRVAVRVAVIASCAGIGAPCQPGATQNGSCCAGACTRADGGQPVCTP